jgi:thymidylate kinase
LIDRKGTNVLSVANARSAISGNHSGRLREEVENSAAAEESTIHAGEPPTPMPGVVAVIGCDGSGKTALTKDLLETMLENGPAERRYLGTVSGEMGNKIKRLPLIGVRFEHYLAAKARRAQDMEKKLPSTATALLMFLFSLRRVRQIREIRELSRSGVMVITDRFPQAEIPGFHYDGPGLPGAQSNNWLIRKLAAREWKLYQWMADHTPALVIRLNVDVETALARKPDHKAAELSDKIAVVPRLTFNGARVIDIDARAPYEAVLEEAAQAIRSNLFTPRAGS